MMFGIFNIFDRANKAWS